MARRRRLYRIYMGACEEALRLQSPQDEIDRLVDYFGAATRIFITAHQEAEGRQLLDGLARLAASPYQVAPNVTNFLTRPANELASAERSAESAGEAELAAFALADWAVAIAYPQLHFGRNHHPLFAQGVRAFGKHPPWDEAIKRVRDSSWNQQWANQIEYRLDVLANVLELAHDLHEGPDGPRFRARKKVIYRDWINITANVPLEIVTNNAAFMHGIEAVNYGVATFGSAEVQNAASRYFASYQTVLLPPPNEVAEANSDELLRTVSAAFEQKTVAAARESVLAAMKQDLWEKTSDSPQRWVLA